MYEVDVFKFNDGNNSIEYYYVVGSYPEEISHSNYKRFISHREDGPAIIYPGSGTNVWYYNNKIHRYNGPSLYFLDVDEKIIDYLLSTWSIHGITVDKKEYLTWLAENDMDINNLSDNDKILIDLKWTT